MKYLRIVSDIHFEFRLPRQGLADKEIHAAKLLEEVIPSDARDPQSLLILAGDISAYWDDLGIVYDKLHTRFEKVLHVPGNHEYYGNDIHMWDRWATEVAKCFPNVAIAKQHSLTVLQEEVFKQSDQKARPVKIVGTTLWTNGGESPTEKLAVSCMNDFRRILLKGYQFTHQNMVDLYLAQRGMLEAELKKKDALTVVVTHHLPSYSLCDPKHSPSPYDGLFASNMDALLGSSDAPAIWVCGHTHYHIDRVLGASRIIANPLGYPGELSTGFQNRLFINLEEM